MRSPPTEAGAATADLAALRTSSERLAADLRRVFHEQVRRALGVDLDASVTSLAYVDHYLAQARREPREPILSLLAAGAGAYFGELVIQTIGGSWLGDGKSPRSLRLLLAPQRIYFSPIDMAFEAIVGESLEIDDPRAPAGAALDGGFHLLEAEPEPRGDGKEGAEEPSDEAFIHEALANFAPVSEDHFYSLTCRYETLQMIVELLAGRQAERGCAPRTYTLEDYVAAFGRGAGDHPR
ncbi:MAG: hypothetical protein R3B09_34945 [Nannocystaceae bacterium]